MSALKKINRVENKFSILEILVIKERIYGFWRTRRSQFSILGNRRILL